MITVTKTEYENMVASAEATLMVKASAINEQLKNGANIEDTAIPLAIAYCNLMNLERYMTGDFNPESFFNINSPYNTSKSYSNTNTIDTGLNK